jgi:hypothetical protein
VWRVADCAQATHQDPPDDGLMSARVAPVVAAWRDGAVGTPSGRAGSSAQHTSASGGGSSSRRLGRTGAWDCACGVWWPG